MTILVTGGAGFIGSNFILDWLEQNDETLAIDWPEAGMFQLSAKDKVAATLDQAEVFV